VLHLVFGSKEDEIQAHDFLQHGSMVVVQGAVLEGERHQHVWDRNHAILKVVSIRSMFDGVSRNQDYIFSLIVISFSYI
jgi:hypothetical protein